MTKKIAVVGVGKLGLCFALNLERSGFEVWGIESDLEYLERLQARSFTSVEPEVNSLLINAKNIHFTSDLNAIANEEIEDVFVMVATPSLSDGGYDHTQIERVAERLKLIGKSDTLKHIYVGCTTMPGYCNELASDLDPHGFTVSYNPEFIAQGSIVKDQLYPDQVLIGEANEDAGSRLQAIYERMVQNNPVYCRMDPLSAEIAKLATNCFLTTKISFANSIGDLATKSGADAEKILTAIGSDSRIGSKYLGYGFGFGGPCFPRDNRALGKYAEEQSYPLRLSNATDKINDEHHSFLVEKYLAEYNEDDVVVLEGVAYKKGTSQLVESQQLRLGLALVKAGRKVKVIDSDEVLQQLAVHHPDVFILQSDSVLSEVQK